MKTLDIEYTLDGRKFTGYLADGSNGKKTAGILVAHEGGGMTNHPQERARMLAQLGYVAFAMDTFGEVITSREQTMAIIGALTGDLPTLRKRALTALNLLKAQPNVDAARTAGIGFCFGGTTVLELARSGADVGCVVGFHSGLDLGARGRKEHQRQSAGLHRRSGPDHSHRATRRVRQGNDRGRDELADAAVRRRRPQFHEHRGGRTQHAGLQVRPDRGHPFLAGDARSV